MAGLPPPRRFRGLDGPAQQTDPGIRGGGAAGADGVMVQPAEDPANRTSCTTGRDATRPGSPSGAGDRDGPALRIGSWRPFGQRPLPDRYCDIAAGLRHRTPLLPLIPLGLA
jgi:hypothetical protein